MLAIVEMERVWDTIEPGTRQLMVMAANATNSQRHLGAMHPAYRRIGSVGARVRLRAATSDVEAVSI